MVRCRQEESAEIQSPKEKVASGRTRRDARPRVCETLAISQEEAEEMGTFTGVTIDAVKRPSDTGRLLQWWLKTAEKPTHSIHVPAVLPRTVECSRVSRD